MAEAGVGDVVELGADAVFVDEAEGELKAGAEFEDVAEVFAAALEIEAGAETGGEDEAAGDEDVVADGAVEVGRFVFGDEEADEGAEFGDGRFEFVFDFSEEVDLGFGDVEKSGAQRDESSALFREESQWQKC